MKLLRVSPIEPVRACLHILQGSACALASLIIVVTSSFAAETTETTAGASSRIDFASQIQPLLARHCYACHGPDLQEGGLRFDDRRTVVAETDSGQAAVVPGKTDESELLRRVLASEESGERMPPEGKPLSQHSIDLLADWIAQGAEFTEHWAFRPPRAPTIPQTVNADWATQPLDQFTLVKLERAGLSPNSPASPQELVRRVYLDVTGLPPAPETVEQLCRDWSEATYIALVERLLASPAFGERWGRVWLDVVRYAETNSFERDGAKPNAWKYRDYVIDAMNGDTPYNQFIREQIAGDELDEVTPASLTATGYYRLGLWDDEPADPLQAIYDGYDDLVTTTSQGFLGLTLNCARCHDHKIDPLLQKDYYAMVAFMRDVTPYATRGDTLTNNQLDLDSDVGRRYDALKSQMDEVERSLREVEQTGIEKMSAAEQRATEGDQREQVLREKLSMYLDSDALREYSELKTELRGLREQRKRLPPRETVLGLAKLDAFPAPTHVMLRGSPHAEGDVVQPSFPRLLGGGAPNIASPAADAHSAGRRRYLADWLASDDNWLTPRVIANRLWLHYFGRGIVRSANNFGLMGDPPTHPELLDYLATELVRDGWHLKKLHRSILLSSTYRMSAHDRPPAVAQDPANDLFWRQNTRRLSAEQIRDSVLAITGQLNQQLHGPSMFVSLSDEVLASQSQPGLGWGSSAPDQQARRSIYIHVKRSLPVPMMTAFDFPETDISCEARFLTTQPSQALTMLNSQWIQQQAAALLHRVEREVGHDLNRQAERCLELSSCASPASEDVADLVDMVNRLKSEQRLSDGQARTAMCLVALNINSFFYVD